MGFRGGRVADADPALAGDPLINQHLVELLNTAAQQTCNPG